MDAGGGDVMSGGDTNVAPGVPVLNPELEPEAVGDMRRGNWGYEIGVIVPLVSVDGVGGCAGIPCRGG